MKKHLKNILVMIMILTGCSNNISKNNIDIYVPYISITKSYDSGGNIIKVWEDELSYNSSGAIIKAELKFSYNEGNDSDTSDYFIETSVDDNGKLETANYIRENKGTSSLQKHKSSTFFNDDGTIKCTKNEIIYDNDDTAYNTYTYEYIQIENIPCLKKYIMDEENSQKILEIEYQNGMPINVSFFDKNDNNELELYKIYNYEYDKFGYISKKECIIYEDETLNDIEYCSYYENIYDENDKIIKIYQTGQDEYGEYYDKRYEFTYDNNDNIINVKIYNDGNIEYVYEYVYKTIQIKKECENYAYIVNSIPDYTWKINK